MGNAVAYLPNPLSRTIALGLTQPLREVRTRNLPGGRGGESYAGV
jgi:hypothetical protein